MNPDPRIPQAQATACVSITIVAVLIGLRCYRRMAITRNMGLDDCTVFPPQILIIPLFLDELNIRRIKSAREPHFLPARRSSMAHAKHNSSGLANTTRCLLSVYLDLCIAVLVSRCRVLLPHQTTPQPLS
jgi:hypothetical protein